MFGIGLLGTVFTHIGLMSIVSDIIDVCCAPVVGLVGMVYAFGEFVFGLCNYCPDLFIAPCFDLLMRILMMIPGL